MRSIRESKFENDIRLLALRNNAVWSESMGMGKATAGGESLAEIH